jgi:hypothetical protein
LNRPKNLKKVKLILIGILMMMIMQNQKRDLSHTKENLSINQMNHQKRQNLRKEIEVVQQMIMLMFKDINLSHTKDNQSINQMNHQKHQNQKGIKSKTTF